MPKHGGWGYEWECTPETCTEGHWEATTIETKKEPTENNPAEGAVKATPTPEATLCAIWILCGSFSLAFSKGWLGLIWTHLAFAVAVLWGVCAWVKEWRNKLGLLIVVLCLASLPVAAQTRFFLPSSGAADVSPPFTLESSWDDVDGSDRLEAVTTRINSALTNKAEAKANTANTRALLRQYVSNPLEAQTIASTTTVKGTIRTLESAGNDNIDKVSLKLLVVSNDGQTLRCTLLAKGDYGPTTEWATTLTNRRIADGDTISAACSVTAGDRVVIEIGFNNTLAGTSITGTENFGDDQGSDCADDQTGTANCNPFVELSQTLTFQAAVVKPARRMFWMD